MRQPMLIPKIREKKGSGSDVYASSSGIAA
jgi:hypothetical protein